MQTLWTAARTKLKQWCNLDAKRIYPWFPAVLKRDLVKIRQENTQGKEEGQTQFATQEASDQRMGIWDTLVPERLNSFFFWDSAGERVKGIFGIEGSTQATRLRQLEGQTPLNPREMQQVMEVESVPPQM